MAGPNNYEPLRETHRQVEAEQNAPGQDPAATQQQSQPKIGSMEFEEADAARRAEIIEKMRADGKSDPHQISYMEKRLENDALVNQNAAQQLADRQAGPETARGNAEITDERAARANDLANGVQARQEQQQEQALSQGQQQPSQER